MKCWYQLSTQRSDTPRHSDTSTQRSDIQPQIRYMYTQTSDTPTQRSRPTYLPRDLIYGVPRHSTHPNWDPVCWHTYLEICRYLYLSTDKAEKVSQGTKVRRYEKVPRCRIQRQRAANKTRKKGFKGRTDVTIHRPNYTTLVPTTKYHKFQAACQATTLQFWWLILNPTVGG